MSPQYDDDEEQRKKLLAAGGPDISSIMAPDEEEEQGGGATATGTPQMTPAMQRFQQILSQQPTQQQPSKFQRFAAALSGMGAGMQNAANGPAAARASLNAPYERAMDQWRNALQGAQMGMTLEEKQQAQAIAAQRAQSYNISAQARMKAADATEKWRQSQEANQPWHPHTQEEATQAELAKKGIVPDVSKPGEYKTIIPARDYVGEENLKAQHAKELEQLRAKQQTDLENARASHEMQRENVRQSGANARANMRQDNKTVTPANQAAAEQQAISEVLRQDPSYRAFVQGGDSVQGAHGATGKTVPYQVKTPDQLPKASSGFLGYGGTSEAQVSLARTQYQEFISKVNQRKQALMSGKSSQLVIEPEEE